VNVDICEKTETLDGKKSGSGKGEETRAAVNAGWRGCRTVCESGVSESLILPTRRRWSRRGQGRSGGCGESGALAGRTVKTALSLGACCRERRKNLRTPS